MSTRRLLPPGYLWIHLAAMVGLHLILPLFQLVETPYRYIGIPLIGIGLWLNIRADRLFKERRTTVKPFEESSALILDGPYRFSRNPMYLGMASALLGVAILLGSLITFLAPITFCVFMNMAFIRYEEKAMETAFGEDYLAYKRRVRSWL